MKRKYPNLCSPIKIGNTIFRNRMFCAPTGGTDISPEGSLGSKSAAFYELRARGGAAAVTISELIPHPETDRSPMFRIDLGVPGSLASFAYAADAISRHGSVASIELSHGGRFAAMGLDVPKYGPSAEGNSAADEASMSKMLVGRTDVPKDEIRELTREQIDDIAAAFGTAAGLAKRAGFGMVMVHGGHSWLINQFFSPRYNKRTDEYGGSLENRCRFAVQVLKSVRAAVGDGFPIEFRISGSESIEGGYDLETAVEIAKIVEPYIDMLHVSAGSHHNGFTVTHPSMFDPHGVNVYLAAEIKKHVSVPVATVGALGDPELMEEIIASGKADVVYMARSLLADPYLPRKVMENRDDEIIHCMRCYACMSERGVTGTRRCALNPRIGREYEGFEISPAPKKRRVLIVGGGPGGLSAAYTAAQRGHDVILCERESRLGGIPNCEEGVPFKSAMYGYARTMERLLGDTMVDIRLDTEVTPEYAEAQRADAIICAVGSSPIVPPIPGAADGRVILVNDMPERFSEIGKRVAVIGGGLAGCEAAVHLGGEGRSVTLIEMRGALAVDANHLQRNALLEMVEKRAETRLGLRAKEINDRGVLCTSSDGTEAFIEADTVILAAGQRARRAEADALLDCAPWVRQIGDCVAPKNMMTAIYGGYHAALDI